MTSSLPDYYINNLQIGSIILGNLDLVGWVIIKKSYDGEHYMLETNQQYSQLNYVTISIIGYMKMRYTNYFKLL